ncbi:hypothetical protein [Synechococcus sp. KORDI-100]|uniref:hypothetical protein n=1 Tax=Synechococcus sp. KORDI-100 TaxID=1280380 RepID=UPI000AC917ED|nr:hypothetical protein [Synechococcus sp. KORDI-100]
MKRNEFKKVMRSVFTNFNATKPHTEKGTWAANQRAMLQEWNWLKVEENEHQMLYMSDVLNARH